MPELRPDLEQKEIEAPEEQDLLEAAPGQGGEQPAQTEAEGLEQMARAARDAVEMHHQNYEETPNSTPEIKTAEAQYPDTKQIKNTAYSKLIATARQQLKPSEQILSKVIHQPLIEKISDISANTVARPSGIIGGSSGALIGSLIVLFNAKRYGFYYNFLIFVYLLAAGFLAGLLVELVLNFLRKHRS